MDFTAAIQLNAQVLAQLDCMMGFAKVAMRNGYVKPSVNDGHALKILDGRHPVIEKQLPIGVPYIANDVFFQ